MPSDKKSFPKQTLSCGAHSFSCVTLPDNRVQFIDCNGVDIDSPYSAEEAAHMVSMAKVFGYA